MLLKFKIINQNATQPQPKNLEKRLPSSPKVQESKDVSWGELRESCFANLIHVILHSYLAEANISAREHAFIQFGPNRDIGRINIANNSKQYLFIGLAQLSNNTTLSRQSLVPLKKRIGTKIPEKRAKLKSN